MDSWHLPLWMYRYGDNLGRVSFHPKSTSKSHWKKCTPTRMPKIIPPGHELCSASFALPFCVDCFCYVRYCETIRMCLKMMIFSKNPIRNGLSLVFVRNYQVGGNLILRDMPFLGDQRKAPRDRLSFWSKPTYNSPSIQLAMYGFARICANFSTFPCSKQCTEAKIVSTVRKPATDNKTPGP